MHKFFIENRNQLLLLIILPLVIFPWAFLGQSRFTGADITKQHQPMRYFDIESVRNGDLPLWNPDIFSGFPQFAEGESGFLYIGSLPQYLPIDFSYAYTIFILITFAITGILSYACFCHSGLDKRISLSFALIWTYSPFLMFHLSAPTIAIVLGLYPALIHLSGSLTGKPLLRLGLMALLASQIIFAGSIQMAFFGFFSYFIYALIRWLFSRKLVPRSGSNLLLLPLAGIILGAIITAVQIIPTLELLSFTARDAGMSDAFRATGSWVDFTRLASIFIFPLINQSSELIHYGSSLLYVGLIPGLFFLAALLGGWSSNRVRTHLLTAIILIILAMGTRFIPNSWMDHIPPFDRFRYYGRFSGFALLHILIASGHWLQGMLGRYSSGKFTIGEFWSVFAAPLGLAAFILVLYLAYNGTSIFILPGIIYLVIQLALFILFFSRAKLRKNLPVIAAVFSLLLAYPIGNLLQLDTDEYKRTLSTFDELALERPGARYIVQREGALLSPDGSGPLFLTPYRTMKGFAGGNSASMSGLNVLSGYAALKSSVMWSHLTDFVHGKEADRNSALNMLVPDYVITREEISLPGYEIVPNVNLQGIAVDGILHRSVNRIPRALYIPGDSPLHDIEGIAGYVEENVKSDGLVSEPESIEQGYIIQTDFPSDGTLVVLEMWYPSWEARIDGNPVEIRKFASLYKAVDVTSGRHEVKFVFRPKSMRTGFYISAIALLFSIILVLIPAGKNVKLVK